ncbi:MULTISPECIES: head-tail connector protein [unclassified Streptomyces]|uniref:head-tail connector protein n=1 Tax=unclassified Streptomyces TaxID=2593676 RepID=UPI0037FD38A9
MALLTLAQAKEQLDIESSANDVELQAFIDGLTAPVERYIGPVLTREVSEHIEGRSDSMCLTHIPAVALVSVTPMLTNGPALDLDTLALDGPNGVVWRQGGTFARTRWTVTYTAGRGNTVPPTISLAARFLLQHLWRTQYGAARGQGGADDFSVSEQIPGFGYAVPNRVLELLEPYKLPPGVA